MTDTLTLTRFVPVGEYEPPAEASTMHGVFVDVETTGLDPETADIIQLAIVPFTFTCDGVLCDAGKPFVLVQYEDPCKPIPELIENLTGITSEMVRGKRIDDDEVMRMVSGAALVVAHNARFDRQVCEKRFPIFKELRWGCSMTDVPWKEEGYTSLKLEWLAFKHCLMFYDSHKADLDCMMAVHLLSTTLPSGKRALAALLENAGANYIRLWATGAPFDTKELLKARGYKWSNGENGRAKAWYIDLKSDLYESEIEWLKANVPCNPKWTSFDAYSRFSDRIGR